MPTTPTQSRIVDPNNSLRWADSVNKYTRLITNGENLVLFPDTSFQFKYIDANTLQIGPGVAIIHDMMIQITENYNVDLSDANFYIDEIAGNAMDAAGYYYVVLHYEYARRHPAPNAYFKIVKNPVTQYSPYDSSLLFLGVIKIVDLGGGVFGFTSAAGNINYTSIDYPEHTRNRPLVPVEYTVDAGTF